MSSRGKWADAVLSCLPALLFGGGLIDAGVQLGDAPQAGLRMLAKGLWALGLTLIGRELRQLVAAVAPRLVGRWRSWLAGRGAAIVGSLVLVLLFAAATVVFVGGALDEHLLGASGHEDVGTRAMLLVLAGCCAGSAGFAVWSLTRVLRNGPSAALTWPGLDRLVLPMLAPCTWSSAARCGGGGARRRTTSSPCLRTRAPSSAGPASS